MNNPGLIKVFIAAVIIEANRIVVFGANEGEVEQASGTTSTLIGVTELGATAGSRVDVTLSGISEVEYGGNISAGDLLTADADGKAVVADTAGQMVLGVAMVSGALGDIGSVHIVPQKF